MKSNYNILGLAVGIIASSDSNLPIEEAANLLRHKESTSIKFSAPTFIHHRIV